MSTNRENNTLSSRRKRTGSLTDPENKTIHSEVFTVCGAKESARYTGSIPVFSTLPSRIRDPLSSHGDSANAHHGRSPVSRTAGINEFYVYDALRRNAKEGERSAARRLSRPKSRLDVCRLSRSFPGRRLNERVLLPSLCLGLLVSGAYLANSVRLRF